MANFQVALNALKNGEKVARRGWRHGFLFLACGLDFYTTANLEGVFKKVGGQCDGKTDPLWHYDCGPAWDRAAICFCPKNRKYGEVTVGWLPRFDDLFAEDWYVIDDATYYSKEEFLHKYDRLIKAGRLEKNRKQREEEKNEGSDSQKDTNDAPVTVKDTQVAEECGGKCKCKPKGCWSYSWQGPITCKEADLWRKLINGFFGLGL